LGPEYAPQPRARLALNERTFLSLAVGGATIKVLFIDHFQDMARGHFIVRILEKAYGEDEVRARYDQILAT
jgi:hypothetical protein